MYGYMGILIVLGMLVNYILAKRGKAAQEKA